jgi:phage shock protein PspC (stress-responsive transcriptional regulator)
MIVLRTEMEGKMDENQPADLNVTPTPSKKRLHRSSSDKMLLGVCGGIGEHFDIDPTFLRLIFAVGVFLGGSTILLYAVLAIIMPSDHGLDLEPRDAAHETMDEAVTEIRSVTGKLGAKLKGLTGKLG